MDDFKKFYRELPSLTQKVRMANESINLAELTDEEKQQVFFHLILLRDDSISLIKKLQEDLNRHAGEWRMTPVTTTVIYGNMDTIGEMLKAVIEPLLSGSEEDSKDASAYESDSEK